MAILHDVISALLDHMAEMKIAEGTGRVMSEPELLATFKPRWRILRHESGNYHIVDASERTLCWIYVRGGQTTDYKLLTDEEARMLAKEIARLSRPRLRD